MDPRCCLLAQTERYFGKKPCCSFVMFSGAYLRARTLWLMETFKAKCKAVFRSRGWFGCFSKPSLIKVDEPSKGRKVKKPSLSEDFWSSSACDMECSSVQSQRKISSISAPNQPLDPSGRIRHPSEFVNHGLLLWNQTRQQWLGNRSDKQAQLRKPTISWNAINESFRGNNGPFPQPVPLPEMVHFLVDLWEQEGLYD